MHRKDDTTRRIWVVSNVTKTIDNNETINLIKLRYHVVGIFFSLPNMQLLMSSGFVTVGVLTNKSTFRNAFQNTANAIQAVQN